MSEASALVKELDCDSEYSAAVGLPPAPEANRFTDNREKKHLNDTGIISD